MPPAQFITTVNDGIFALNAGNGQREIRIQFNRFRDMIHAATEQNSSRQPQRAAVAHLTKARHSAFKRRHRSRHAVVRVVSIRSQIQNRFAHRFLLCLYLILHDNIVKYEVARAFPPWQGRDALLPKVSCQQRPLNAPTSMKNILVLNGPNLNMLGIREPNIYGKQDYPTLVAFIQEAAAKLGLTVDVRQSNHEGVLVDWIQEALGKFDGIVINPAAYTHTSVAILDALKAVALPAVEVHLSDVSAREPFRQISYAGMACRKTFAGHGFDGYRLALEFLTTL